jgi:hypothetical protein
MPGSLLGPTFHCLFSLQFLNYKVGDRFYYENNFHPTGFTPGKYDTFYRKKKREKKFHAVGPFQKFNRKIAERGKIYTPNTNA